ncbi:MAG TPA: hypothetical protein VL651_14465 [Bacteroidia bacterium]|jgi:hypothetical protein|nr:hypothetical protein [Bacteroidia bacterium]
MYGPFSNPKLLFGFSVVCFFLGLCTLLMRNESGTSSLMISGVEVVHDVKATLLDFRIPEFLLGGGVFMALIGWSAWRQNKKNTK